ncbi:hypothetical protein N9954_06005 [Maribacter sp.]|nr:hypothetical protein [Maribacter sp.]
MANNSQPNALDAVSKVKKIRMHIKEATVYTGTLATAWLLYFMNPTELSLY